jgi:hypothetical protein
VKTTMANNETFDPDVKLLIEEGRKKGFLT